MSVIWEDVDTFDIAFQTPPHSQRARHPHRCMICGRPIRRGQLYTRVFARIDGETHIEKWHGVREGECLGAEGV